MSDHFLSPPPFQPQAAVERLQRELRELGLAPRAGVWEWKGRPVLKVAVDGDALQVALVKRPARTPDWSTQRLGDHAGVRRLVEQLRASMRHWNPED